MKRFLGIVILSLFFVIPAKVSAAYTVDVSKGCEKNCNVTESGYCENTCTIGITDNTESLTSLNLDLQVGEGVTIKAINTESGWENLTGTSANAQFITTGNAVTASSFDLAKIVLQYKAGVDCSLKVNIDGKETKTVQTTETKTVSTGASLPIILLIGGAVAAVSIYFVSKKNSKMYKI